jgi:hypothetical protein
MSLRDMSVVSSRSRFLVDTVGLRPGAPPVQGWNLPTGQISGLR